MLTKTLRITNARNAKTLSPSHMKQCIMSENRFDFLRELVKNIPDINVAEEQQGDSYPERRESSEDGALLIDSPPISNANGVISNPNGSTISWKIKAHDESNASSSGGSSHWKFTKQHSMDSISTKNQNNYSTDNNSPINYSIKIKVDDKPPPAKLLRMESTPASFGSNNNLASPIVTPNYVPITTKLTDNDKQPIINFDFTKIPLMPSTASTSRTANKPSNHSHSVSNILKINEKVASATDSAKIEVSFFEINKMPMVNKNKKKMSFDFISAPISAR